MYAQTNYQQKQGINGKYTIAQIGCFITAFSNLAERLNGSSGDPVWVNRRLVELNAYIDVDDGIRDDVGFGTYSVIDPTVAVVSQGLGSPRSNNSIVKFVYNGGQTHFSLVADAAKGTIIDSWDGKIKPWSIYGGPKQWATYKKISAQAPSVNSGSSDMITSEYFVQALYLKFWSRQATKEELDGIVGKLSFQDLIKYLDNDAAEKTARNTRIGEIALANDWQGQIQTLTTQAEELRKNPTKENLTVLQQQLDKCTIDFNTAKAELAAADQQAAQDEKAGQSFLRWIFSKFRKGE